MVLFLNRLTIKLMTFKWGIVGPGNIAHEFAHDLRYVEGGTHEVRAVVGHNMKSANAFSKEEHVVECYDNLTEMLQRSSVDAIYIATPHTFHHEQTIACLQQGIPVLCEKPIAINTQQVEEMIDASVKYQTFLMEG